MLHAEPGPDLNEQAVAHLARELRLQDYTPGVITPFNTFDPSTPQDAKYMRMARVALRFARPVQG